MIGIYAGVEVIDAKKQLPRCKLSGAYVVPFSGISCWVIFPEEAWEFRYESRHACRLVTILALKWMNNHQKM